jgi:thioredoxin-like negative regulator of GroEL
MPSRDTFLAMGFALSAGAGMIVLLLLFITLRQLSTSITDTDTADSRTDVPVLSATPQQKGLREIASETDFLAASQDAPVVVMFYTPWCGACTMAKPMVARMAATAAVKVLAINCQKAPRDMMTKYGIRAFPTFVRVQEATVVSTLVGANPQRLQAMMEE